MAEQDKDSPGERIRLALEPDVPKIYFNGFVNSFSAGDVMCVLEKNNQPVGVLNMSYTVAKTLSASLAELIGTLETVSEQPIMTTHEIGRVLSGSSEPPEAQPKLTTRKKAGRGRARKPKID